MPHSSWNVNYLLHMFDEILLHYVSDNLTKKALLSA